MDFVRNHSCTFANKIFTFTGAGTYLVSKVRKVMMRNDTLAVARSMPFWIDDKVVAHMKTQAQYTGKKKQILKTLNPAPMRLPCVLFRNACV